MARWSALLALLAVSPTVAACVESSPSGVVVAPLSSTSASSLTLPAPDASTDAALDDDASAPAPAPMGDGDAGAPARYRACKVDADCVAVPRVGCCHNGWNQAVATTQKSAYTASFTCPDTHPICAMFIVRDTRTARCDATSHLCTLVSTASPP
jgi:hypothetical protein